MQTTEKVTPQEPDLEPHEVWDDTKLRHAYFPSDRKVAMCGYAGPSTFKGECQVPANVCPICIAILPEYWDGKKWFKTKF